jgi:hypothetical protein
VATIPVPTNSPRPKASRYTTGSSTLEKVVDFQYVRKFATSRLMIPVMAAGSSRLMAEAPGSAGWAPTLTPLPLP